MLHSGEQVFLVEYNFRTSWLQHSSGPLPADYVFQLNSKENERPETSVGPWKRIYKGSYASLRFPYNLHLQIARIGFAMETKGFTRAMEVLPCVKVLGNGLPRATTLAAKRRRCLTIPVPRSGYFPQQLC